MRLGAFEVVVWFGVAACSPIRKDGIGTGDGAPTGTEGSESDGPTSDEDGVASDDNGSDEDGVASDDNGPDDGLIDCKDTSPIRVKSPRARSVEDSEGGADNSSGTDMGMGEPPPSLCERHTDPEDCENERFNGYDRNEEAVCTWTEVYVPAVDCAKKSCELGPPRGICVLTGGTGDGCGDEGLCETGSFSYQHGYFRWVGSDLEVLATTGCGTGFVVSDSWQECQRAPQGSLELSACRCQCWESVGGLE